MNKIAPVDKELTAEGAEIHKTMAYSFNIYSFLRERERERERERASMSWGGAERVGDTESEAGSRF